MTQKTKVETTDLDAAPVSQGAGSSRRKGAIGTISRVANVATGASYYRRTANYALERAKFPLLRRVIRNEYESQKQNVELSLIDTRFIKKTLFWQKYLAVFYLIVGCYALLSISRGLAAGIRYDMWLTHWLYMGAALLAFAAARGLITYKVIKGCSVEMQLRKNDGAVTSRDFDYEE